ncbi:MAG: TraR/DksA C4-type zinc finger protein [Actinomycetes bacterium]
MPSKRGVRPDESPWTPEELESVRAGLQDDRRQLVAEIKTAETDIAGLVNDSGEGAGDDAADAGFKTFEREHEMQLAENHRELLLQTDRALSRLDGGTYGICEVCGGPVGKARLQAFPRATLCMACKQEQERHN